MKKWIKNNLIVCRYCFHLSKPHTTYCYHCGRDIDRQFADLSIDECEKVYEKAKIRLTDIFKVLI